MREIDQSCEELMNYLPANHQQILEEDIKNGRHTLNCRTLVKKDTASFNRETMGNSGVVK